jgi:hypothetical protein
VMSHFFYAAHRNSGSPDTLVAPGFVIRQAQDAWALE